MQSVGEKIQGQCLSGPEIHCPFKSANNPENPTGCVYQGECMAKEVVS